STCWKYSRKWKWPCFAARHDDLSRVPCFPGPCAKDFRQLATWPCRSSPLASLDDFRGLLIEVFHFATVRDTQRHQLCPGGFQLAMRRVGHFGSLSCLHGAASRAWARNGKDHVLVAEYVNMAFFRLHAHFPGHALGGQVLRANQRNNAGLVQLVKGVIAR